MEIGRKNPKNISLNINEYIDKHAIQAFVIKTGFVFSTLRDKYKIDPEKKGVNQFFDNYLLDLYASLAKEDSIIEIFPNEKYANDNPDHFFISVSGGFNFPCFSPMLDLRVVISERKRNDLFSRLFTYDSYKPETFHIIFDGCLFFSYSKINQVPISTDIGHISREILKNIFKDNEYVEINEIGPSPIHINIFLIVLDKYPPTDSDFKPILLDEDNLYITVLKDSFSDNSLDIVCSKMRRILTDFYQLQMIRSDVFDSVDDFRIKENELANELMEYFSDNFFIRVFNRHISKIRKTISELHLIMNNLSRIQLLYKNSRNDFFRDLSDDRLLNLLDKYFLRHLEEDLLCFDLKSELSTISFAIAETSDRLLIRSTLVSGLIGGIIGFLLSLL